jgi:hypothetical protein
MFCEYHLPISLDISSDLFHFTFSLNKNDSFVITFCTNFLKQLVQPGKHIWTQFIPQLYSLLRVIISFII